MKTIIEFEASVIEHYEYDYSYYLTMDLIHNYKENVEEWEEFFKRFNGKLLKITVQVIEV